MERLSLKSDFEGDEGKPQASLEEARLQKIDKELEKLKKDQEELSNRWMAERGGVDRANELKEKIAAVELEIAQCERDYDLNRAAELKFSTLPSLQEQLEKVEELVFSEAGKAGEKMLRDEVNADDIAAVVAVWTGIPPQKLLETERERILTMGDKLKERVVGQDDAVEVVTEAIQRSRAGLSDPTKPIASLIFLGPTGVGKTELCKALAEFMFDSEDMLIRMDMSEYMEKHTVSRLIGAPPGYVGYDEGGQLTDAVRRKPYSVILFDEMEKAHPDVFNIMLQMLDDGRVTDSKGNIVNFKNTIVIFTSNVGSQDILDLNEGDREIMRERVTEAMKAKFRPEFLNRIDEYVIFNSLSKADLRGIVKLEVKKLESRLQDRAITMTMSDAALDYLADIGFDPVYGARPLKRAIQRELEIVLAQGILRGDYTDGDAILIDTVDGKIAVKRAINAAAMQAEKEVTPGGFD
jgi:ATP-dependent Clp protease ATP-binding subunit ClpB